MKNAGALADRTKKELADLARKRGVRGWESMDKAALLKALAKDPPAGKPVAKPTVGAAKVTKDQKSKSVAKSVAKAPATPAKGVPVKPAAVKAAPAKPATAVKSSKPAPKPPAAVANGSHKPTASVPKPLVAPKPAAKPTTRSLIPARDGKDAAARVSPPVGKDRIVLTVSNPYWLNVHFELSTYSIQRAEAALRQDWHGARLVIRLFDVTSGDTTSTSETPVKDVVVHGTGPNWYIEVPQPPRTYRADIGYVSKRGDFYMLARSNQVNPPKAGSPEAAEVMSGDWDDTDSKWRAERILAMSSGFESRANPELREFLEERTGRPLGPPKETAFGTGAVPPGSVKKFFFDIDAKLIVFGRTDPSAYLTLNNDRIKLNPDGTFRMTLDLPDSRQIIPAVAASADGVEERTIVLAVERNTKHLDPMIHDQMNEV